jgi:hypothetical protein
MLFTNNQWVQLVVVSHAELFLGGFASADYSRNSWAWHTK